jgi:hypothetical protein
MSARSLEQRRRNGQVLHPAEKGISLKKLGKEPQFFGWTRKHLFEPTKSSIKISTFTFLGDKVKNIILWQ